VSARTPVPRPGDPAPELLLPDTHGALVSLIGLRGSPVALVFFLSAFSDTCTREVRELCDNLDEFEVAGVRLLGITCDSRPALRAWSDREGLGFDLLSDFWPHGAAARSFGVFDDSLGMAERGSFLIDADGIVRWQVVNAPSHPRDFGAYRAALAGL
jgi:peroxiredoxin